MTSELLKRKIEENRITQRIKTAGQQVQGLATSLHQPSLIFYLDDDEQIVRFTGVNQTFNFAFINPKSNTSSSGRFSTSSDLATQVLTSFEALSLRPKASDLILLYSETVDFLVELDVQSFRDHCEEVLNFILECSYSDPHSGAYLLSKDCTWLVYISKFHGSFEVITSVEHQLQ